MQSIRACCDACLVSRHATALPLILLDHCGESLVRRQSRKKDMNGSVLTLACPSPTGNNRSTTSTLPQLAYSSHREPLSLPDGHPSSLWFPLVISPIGPTLPLAIPESLQPVSFPGQPSIIKYPVQIYTHLSCLPHPTVLNCLHFHNIK